MAAKIRTYQVASGCIQEGDEVFTLGDSYIPPTAVLEKELLAAGVIELPGQLLAELEAEAKAKAEAEAKAKAEAEAQAEAEAKAKGQ